MRRNFSLIRLSLWHDLFTHPIISFKNYPVKEIVEYMITDTWEDLKCRIINTKNR